MAEWDAAYINDLPDSAFACIDAGGDKEDGKTVPRSLRHYPHHNAAGEVDRPHLANALARVAQAGTAACGEAHLNQHAEALGMGERSESDELLTTSFLDSDLTVRSLERREIEARIVPWNTVIDSPIGLESFQQGAFAGVDPRRVVLRLEHENPPAGRGVDLQERSDGAYMTFKVSKTPRGDEILTLAQDGVTSHVSLGYQQSTSQGDMQYRGGQRFMAWQKADLKEVSTTWRPYYAQADILSVRAKQDAEEVAPVSDQETKAPETGAKEKETEQRAELQTRSIVDALATVGNQFSDANAALLERMEKLEERARSQFTVPGAPEEKTKVTSGQWMQYALRALSGERISGDDMQYRAVADVITSDNLGVVPDTFLQNELIGVIDPARPFMSSTRRLPTPTSGMTLHVPVLDQRPVVGLQSEEKTELASQAIKVTSADFSAVTKGGVIDISLQLLKLSSPPFLDLALSLMAEAYAIESETEAIEALLGADVDDGHTLNPAQPNLGAAFTTAFDVIRRGPDTIWLSSAAVGAFIDAVAPVSGLPMYSNIVANATAGGGITGSVSGLRAVHVPALGSLGADVIVGPSSGFAWAEAGTYSLQVDVPSRAGRDVALVGILWFAPYYPSAFTVYTLES